MDCRRLRDVDRALRARVRHGFHVRVSRAVSRRWLGDYGQSWARRFYCERTGEAPRSAGTVRRVSTRFHRGVLRGQSRGDVFGRASHGCARTAFRRCTLVARLRGHDDESVCRRTSRVREGRHGARLAERRHVPSHQLAVDGQPYAGPASGGAFACVSISVPSSGELRGMLVRAARDGGYGIAGRFGAAIDRVQRTTDVGACVVVDADANDGGERTASARSTVGFGAVCVDGSGVVPRRRALGSDISGSPRWAGDRTPRVRVVGRITGLLRQRSPKAPHEPAPTIRGERRDRGRTPW